MKAQELCEEQIKLMVNALGVRGFVAALNNVFVDGDAFLEAAIFLDDEDGNLGEWYRCIDRIRTR